MRLTQIKLAGFKSFVDPTTIPTPSQLVGVVGPNGCGKSNIIDAVRWVLGESRASELRGESMQDVIFNGSGQRKPAARASVELIFDNSEQRAAGQWSQYSEIAVGRVLTRDGQSSYYLNNQQVRRRDVQDLFLGTGLGARGYAIIGQGMINRLIEAKPEELRVYLEEAAGVSRYKERRRETENRLHHTRENLQRLDDILAELVTQLERLHAQAEVAQQYQALQHEGERKQLALWLLKERQAQHTQQQKFAAIEKAQAEVEAAIASVRKHEADIERLRLVQQDLHAQAQQAQAQVFEAAALVSSLEAELRHASESRQRMTARQHHLITQQDEWATQQAHCEHSVAELTAQLELAAETVYEAEASAEHVHEQLPELEERLQALLRQREQAQQQLSQLERTQALTHQALLDAQRQRQQLLTRHDRLLQEQQQLPELDDDALQALEHTQQHQQTHLEAAQSQVQATDTQLADLEEQRTQAQHSLQQQQQQLGRLEARIQALTQLQDETQRQAGLEPWLVERGWQDWPRLWQQLELDSAWSTAFEAVLQQRLLAISAADWECLQRLVEEPPPARLSVVVMPELISTSQPVPDDALLHRLRLAQPALQQLLVHWLQGVRCAPSLENALNRVTELGVGECWVCPEGHRVETHSVHIYAPDQAAAGLLERQHELEALTHQAKAQQFVVDQAQAHHDHIQQQWQRLRQSLPSQRQRLAELTQHVHQLHIEFTRQHQQADQAQQRRVQLKQELAELTDELEQVSAQIELHHEQLETGQENLDEAQQRLQQATEDSERHSLHVQDLRQQQRDKERHWHEAQQQERLLQARVEELHRTQRMAQEQYERAQAELQTLQGELQAWDADQANAQLQQALTQRVDKDAHFARVGQQLDVVNEELRQHEQRKAQLEHTLEPLRAQVTALQLEEQAARLAVEQFQGSLDERQVDRQALAQSLMDEDERWQRPQWLQSEVQRLARQAEALGPVNLAALEELNAAQARQGYLQSQHDDLQSAIDTLEDAIRKIDREIRDLLMTTFNAVNGHFGELFPRLFGGGEARLSLTEEDVLEAGVQVMAQPPGKRNSTIHLLSGGEKALTATALVFALFKLNPAPFCLLDEVDAPLDDANTERYANLVSSMSEQTQFLFISHNKIAMHMAKQLVGVTMQEQGVSRIVAVDMDAALQMADA